MRIAIIEDQSDDAAILLHFLAQWSEKQQIPLAPQPECFSSGEEFLTTFSGGSYDLLFLDIYLKDLNGMETARRIREMDPDCKIIFTTSSTEFAVESYDVNASWYLVKPFSYETFAKAMSHCETEALEQRQSILLPGEALQNRIYLHQISYAELHSDPLSGRQLPEICHPPRRFCTSPSGLPLFLRLHPRHCREF